jgi:hypothetical protein
VLLLQQDILKLIIKEQEVYLLMEITSVHLKMGIIRMAQMLKPTMVQLAMK